MKIYLIGFGLVFIGFCLGYITAVICMCASRADDEEEKILRSINKEVHK